MSNYDDTDTGVLFKNEKKQNDKQPDYTGNIYDANGEKRRLAAWIRESKGGKKFMSLKVSDFDFEREAIQSEPRREPINDDIPFN